MLQRISHVFAVLGLLAFFGGCAPWATYPPIQGAAQLGRPDYEPGPSIMAAAIRHTYERHAQPSLPEGPIVFNLPEGLPAEVYDRVVRRLGPEVEARPMTPEDERAIHITSVRVRAFDSQVDVVYPRRDGLHEMIMLSMRQDLLNRHKVTGSRLWRLHVAVPPAHYVAPPPKETRRGATAVAGAAPDGEAVDEGIGGGVQAGVMTDDVSD